MTGCGSEASGSCATRSSVQLHRHGSVHHLYASLPGVRQVLPNRETDPDFARALEEAEKAGVEILHLPCAVGPDRLEILD